MNYTNLRECSRKKIRKNWWCHSFCLFFIFYNIHTYIHTITFIHSFAEASLHFFIAILLSGGASLWCRDENRTRACLPASRRATNNCATPHHFQLCHAAQSQKLFSLSKCLVPCTYFKWTNFTRFLFQIFFSFWAHKLRFVAESTFKSKKAR